MKVWLLVFLFMLSLSCKNEVKENTITNDNETVDYEPLFLDLSPHMDGTQFYDKLYKNPSLDNGFFTIPINNVNAYFKVSKLSDRIFLEYSDIISISPEINTNEGFYHRAFIRNDSTITEFIKLFRTQYGNPVYLLPFSINKNGDYINPYIKTKEYIDGIENKELSDYAFEKRNYLVFKDSLKTVLIGFTNSNGTDFGIELEISYFHNLDFEKLLKEMRKDKSDFETAKIKRDSLNSEEQNSLNKNRNKI